MTNKKAKALSRKEQGELTRQNLMETGVRLFALNGYHGVSVRKLASEAGANLAAIGYHFGGKSGLYKAILQDMIDIRYEIFPSAQEVKEHFAGTEGDKGAQAEAVTWFTETMTTGILGHNDHIWPAFIILHELARPTKLFPKLKNDFFDPSFAALRLLVESVLPEDADQEEIVIVAHCLIGMVIIFLDGFYLITERLSWENYEGYGAKKIAEVLGRRVRGFLGLP